MFGAPMVTLRAKQQKKQKKRHEMYCPTRSLNTKAFVAQGQSFDREDDFKCSVLPDFRRLKRQNWERWRKV